MSVAVAVEIVDAPDAPSHVVVTVTGLNATPEVVSVQTSHDQGSSWRTVRGADHTSVVDATLVRDHVPALNLPLLYRVVRHDEYDESTTSEEVTVVSAYAVLSDPFDPHSAVLLSGLRTDEGAWLLLPSLTDATYEQPSDSATPIGASLPVHSVGRRLLAGKVPLTIKAIQDGGRLRGLLLSAGVLVLRMHKPTVLEPVAHILTGAAVEKITQPGGGPGQVSQFDLTVMQTRPTSLSIVVPWFTYAQVAALYEGMTYTEVKDSKPGASYLDWQREPRP